MRSIILCAAFGATFTAQAAEWVYEYRTNQSAACLAARNVTHDYDHAELIVRLTETRWRAQEKPQIAVPILLGHIGSYADSVYCPTDVVKQSFPCGHTYTAKYRLDDDAWTEVDFGLTSSFTVAFATLRALLPPPAVEVAMRVAPKPPKPKVSNDPDAKKPDPAPPPEPPSSFSVEYESRAYYGKPVTTVAQIRLDGLQNAYDWVRGCAAEHFTATTE